MVRRVLIPLDGSELAEQILEPALAIGAATQVEYTLLRVVQPTIPGGHVPASAKVSGVREPLPEQMQALHHQEWAQAQEYLERLAERLRSRSTSVQTRVVAHEQPAAAIFDDARKNAVDLIARLTGGAA